MSFSYLNNKTWSQITREERLFCFELYDAARKNPNPLLKRINREYLIGDNVEIGVEVCFFRDLIYENQKKIGKSGRYL